MSINIAISIITFFVTIILSLLVLFQDFRSRINQRFFFLCFSISLWIACNFLADLSPELNWALFFSRFAIIWTALLPLLFNELITHLYFENDKTYKPIYRVSLFFSCVINGLIIIFSQTSYNIESITKQAWGIDFQPGILYYVLFIYLILAFGFSFYYLFQVYKKFSDPMRSQARIMLFGALTTAFLAIITNLISPLLGNSFISVFGPPTVLFFVGFTAIAVLKHHLFNVKVLATELLSFALWIFILIRALIADTMQDRIIESSLLLITIIFGIFLIKSVIREVDQREKIELLATDLQKANTRLTELDRQKSEFVSFATHQLRAPLTAMKGYASLILEGDLGEISKEVRDAISRIFESSNTLTSIVDDYLNVTRIELGTMKYAFETIDLKQLVEDVIGELKPNIDKSKLAFSFKAENSGTDYRITADKDKLKQVIVNLIDNSMKYTPQGSVEVTLSLDKPRHLFIFKIKDTGIGIAPETVPRLFAKFTRAGNANKTNIKGTGLGLYVAKEMILAHHGTIHAESEGEGKGSAFIVELEPFAKA